MFPLLLGTTLNSVLILLSSFSPKKGICNCITKTYNSSYKSREIFVACYSIHFSFSSNCKPTYLFSGIKQDFFCKAVPPLFSLFDPHDVFLPLRMDFIVDLLQYHILNTRSCIHSPCIDRIMPVMIKDTLTYHFIMHIMHIR